MQGFLQRIKLFFRLFQDGMSLQIQRLGAPGFLGLLLVLWGTVHRLPYLLLVIFGTYSSIYIANTILVRLRVSQKTILKEDKKT